jgi:hypothetical protein
MAGNRNQKPRRRKRVNAGRTGGSTLGNKQLTNRATAVDPGTWICGTHEFIINTLNSTKANNVWTVRLSGVPSVQTLLTGCGEFRFLRLSARFGPITAATTDRIALNPFLEDSNSFEVVAEFAGNNRRIRRGDQNFTEVWSAATQVQEGALSSTTQPTAIPGGVNVYFYKSGAVGAPSPDFGLVTCNLSYCYRGKRAAAGLVPAS